MPWVEKISIELAPTYENATAIMKYSALVWMVMTSKLKPIVKDYWKEGNVNDLMKKQKAFTKICFQKWKG